MPHQLHIVSFADSRLSPTLSKRRKEILELDIFDHIHLLNEKSLPGEFASHFSSYLNPLTRGYGYWVWKPQVILQALSMAQNDDIVLYVDGGVSINPSGKPRLLQYFDIIRSSGSSVLAFSCSTPSNMNSIIEYDGRPLLDHKNYQWCKGDLFDYYDVRTDISYTHSAPIGAGILFLRKSDQSISFVQEWLSVFYTDFHLVDDSPSNSPNLPGFIEHRHDQAILSMLGVKHCVPCLSAYEYWYPCLNDSDVADWDVLSGFPFHARGDKQMRLFSRIKSKLSRCFI